MSHLLPARWLAALPALAALTALAESGPPSTEPTSATTALPYQSAFDTYQRYKDDKPADWKQANDTVRQRGGWRAYAKESEGPAHEGHEAPAKTDPHAGHGMPASAAPARKAPQ